MTATWKHDFSCFYYNRYLSEFTKSAIVVFINKSEKFWHKSLIIMKPILLLYVVVQKCTTVHITNFHLSIFDASLRFWRPMTPDSQFCLENAITFPNIKVLKLLGKCVSFYKDTMPQDYPYVRCPIFVVFRNASGYINRNQGWIN